MEIDTTDPVGSQLQRLEASPKNSRLSRDKDGGAEPWDARMHGNPDYRICLSDASKTSIADLAGTKAPGQGLQQTDLSEDEAVRVAQQVSEQLMQTSGTISNLSIQKAVDLFT